MKTFYVVLVIIGIIVIGFGIFIANSAVQAKRAIDSIDLEGTAADFDAVREGDCTKLPGLEQKVKDAKEKILDACKNPTIDWVAVKVAGRDICLEVKNPNNEVEQELQELKEKCANPEE